MKIVAQKPSSIVILHKRMIKILVNKILQFEKICDTIKYTIKRANSLKGEDAKLWCLNSDSI